MNKPVDASELEGNAGELPLAGIRVLECCHTVMGPTCGMILGDLGAEVIKLEPAPQGDRTRSLQGFQIGSFSFFNRNKKSIALNLKTKKGRDILHQLVADVDVVAENYAPGAAERIGLGYEELSKINQRLIYCSLKGYLPGPYENRAALDEVVQFQTGLAYMTGPPGQPLRAGASVVDIMGGVFGAIAILAALRERDKTGRGQKVTSSLFESCAFLVGQHMAGMAVTGVEPPPTPIKVRSWAIYETFKARDGETVFLGLTSNNHWKTFCEVFGREELLAESRFGSNEARLAAHKEVQKIVQEEVDKHTVAELVDLLAPKGIPISPVARPVHMFEDPHLNASGGLVHTTLTTGTETKLPALPIAMAGKRMGLRLQPPKLGEHTHEILGRYGISPDEVDRLIETEIVR